MRDLTLETLLWEVMLKRSCAEVKRSTSRILAVMGSAVRNTRASVSLKPIVLYTAEKGMRFSVEKYLRFNCNEHSNIVKYLQHLKKKLFI